MRREQSIIRPSESSLFQSQPRVQFWLDQKSPEQSPLKLNRSLLLKSKNVSKNYKYVKYDLQGNTQLINEPKQLEEDFSYQKVHLQENDHIILGEEVNWSKDMQKLSSAIRTKKKIVMRSIRKLWQRNYRPQFFDWIEQTKGISYQYPTYQIPQCLYELEHLSVSHKKFMFITQDFSENGLYKVILNEDGRYRLVTVDDMIPVLNESNQHLWGIEEPWKMILLKVWACLNEGYDNILKNHRPFNFLEYFTGNNWKYFNLQREGFRWINNFKDYLEICYIVLQTKNSQIIHKMGLVADSIAYNIVRITNDSERGVQIEVRSRFKHKWKGKLNLVNYNTKLWKDEGKEFRLEKNFLLTKDEFFDVFCCAYITSLSKSNSHVTDYMQIDIPKNTKNAVYLKFSIKKEGFLDFSFIQSHKNRVPLESAGSRIDSQNYHKQTGIKSASKTRFLKCKYMLIKSLRGSTKPFESKLSRLGGKNQLNLTKSTRYEAYEVEYLRGYNKGEAHFIMMEPGDYYFRLKSQTVNRDAVYYLNYCCSEKLEISEEVILGEQRQYILQNCILSLLPACTQVRHKSCTIYSGNKFEDIGYGFIVIENTTHKTKYPKRISFQINTQQLYLEGYKLKEKKYKNSNKPNIVLEINPEAHLVLILKKVSDDPTLTHLWPPKSIGISRQN